MSDHRQSTGEESSGAARPLQSAVRDHLEVATTDLFLPPQLRLTEWQRTLMRALLDRLVNSVEEELVAGLARYFQGRGDATSLPFVSPARASVAPALLEHGGALKDRALVALLLRRAEEHRLHRTSNVDPDSREGLLGELIRDHDEEVAQAAMSVLIAQNRRLDRFQEPLLPRADLPAEVLHRLVWSIAGALRPIVARGGTVSTAEADDALASAVNRALATHDESEGSAARCLRLARLLEIRERLNGTFLVRVLPETGLSLFVAGLSLRCGLLLEDAWQLLLEPTGQGFPLLLRAAGLERSEAGRILVAAHGSGAADEDAQLIRQLDLFDSISLEEARRRVRDTGNASEMTTAGAAAL